MKHAHAIFIGIVITGFIALNGMAEPSDAHRTVSVGALDLDGEDAVACRSRHPVVPQRADRIKPEAPTRSDLQPAVPPQYQSSLPPEFPRHAPTFSEYINTAAVQDPKLPRPASPPKSPPHVAATSAQSKSRAAHGSGLWNADQRPNGTKRPGNPDHQSMRRGEQRNGRATIEELIAQKQREVEIVPQSIELYFVNDSAKKLPVKIFVQEGDKLYPIIQRTAEKKRTQNLTKLEKVPYDGNEMLISLSRIDIPGESMFALTVDASKPAKIFLELPEGKSLMQGRKLAIRSVPNRALVYSIGINDTEKLTYDGQSKPITSDTQGSVEKWIANKISKSNYTVYHFEPNKSSNSAPAAAYAEISVYTALPTLKSYES